MMLKSTIGRLRLLGILEGISFLILLGVCVPLKYGFGIEEPTKVVGLIHGILFIAYCLWVLMAAVEYKWSFKTSFYAFIASLLPFGTIVADKRIFKKYDLQADS